MENLEWADSRKNMAEKLSSYLPQGLIQKLINASLIEDNPSIRSDVDTILGIYAPKILFSKKPMLACPSKEEVSGELVIGNVLHGDKEFYEFGLNRDEMIQHQLILGRSGSGKTTLIINEISELRRLNIPFISFDFKRDLRHLIKHFPELWVFRYDDLRINFLEPPPKVSIQKWEQIFCDLYSFNYGWFHGSRNLMQEYLHELYQEKGEKATLPQLYQKIKEAQEQTRKRQEYYDVVTNRLFSTVTNFGKVIDYEKSYPPIEELLNHFVVIELDQLARDEQNLLVEFFLFWIYEYRKAHGHRGRLKHVLIFDEAKRIFDATKEFRESTQETGVAPIDIITDEIRDFGEALIVSDQEPSKLTHSIKANTYCKIVGFLGHGKDISDIAEAMDLNEDEREALTKLERGEWLVKLAGRYTKPFMMKSKDFPLVKDVSDEELKQRMKPIIDELSKDSVKPKVEVKQTNSHLSEDAWKLLIHINEHPFQGIVGRVRELQFSGRRIELAKQELIGKNLAKEVGIVITAKKPTLFLELTNEALSLLESKGLDTAQWKHIGNVGFEHVLYQVLIRYEYKKLGYEAHIEANLPNGKRIDVLAIKGDKKAGVEVELNPYNVQADKFPFIEELDELYILTNEEKNLKVIQSRLGSSSDKVKLSTIRDFLTHLHNIKRNYCGIYPSGQKEAEFNRSRNLIGGQNG